MKRSRYKIWPLLLLVLVLQPVLLLLQLKEIRKRCWWPPHRCAFVCGAKVQRLRLQFQVFIFVSAAVNSRQGQQQQQQSERKQKRKKGEGNLSDPEPTRDMVVSVSLALTKGLQ